MPVTLSAALDKNQDLLGKNFENLGIKRYALSYDRLNGWSVEKFQGIIGLIKRIFRKVGSCFGLYQRTHLKTIQAQIQKEGKVPEKLLSIILKKEISNGSSKKKANMEILKLPLVNEDRVVYDIPKGMEYCSKRVHGTLVQYSQGDLRTCVTTAIVNAANPACLGGAGIDGAIHEAAGKGLLEQCKSLPVKDGVRCPVGGAVITGSGNLANDTQRKRIIHTVGPDFRKFNGNEKEAEEAERLLKQSYTNCLKLAQENGIRSLSFPAISTGIYKFPFDRACKIAFEAVSEYLGKNPNYFNEINFVFSNMRLSNDALGPFQEIYHT